MSDDDKKILLVGFSFGFAAGMIFILILSLVRSNLDHYDYTNKSRILCDVLTDNNVSNTVVKNICTEKHLH